MIMNMINNKYNDKNGNNDNVNSLEGPFLPLVDRESRLPHRLPKGRPKPGVPIVPTYIM